MPDKLPILPITFVQDEAALRAWSVVGIEQRRITRRQFSAITLLARRHLPCQVELLQRSAKSVLYLHIRLPGHHRQITWGKLHVTLNLSAIGLASRTEIINHVRIWPARSFGYSLSVSLLRRA